MFKDLIKANKHTNMGFPIAEVEYDGTFNIAKEKNTGGLLMFLLPIVISNQISRMRNGGILFLTAALRDSGATVLQLRCNSRHFQYQNGADWRRPRTRNRYQRTATTSNNKSGYHSPSRIPMRMALLHVRVGYRREVQDHRGPNTGW